MTPSRAELHRLADSLSEGAAEELAAAGRILDKQVRTGAYEDVTDPEEIKIILDAIQINRSVSEFTPEEAKSELAAWRQRRPWSHPALTRP